MQLVACSTVANAKALLKSAIRSDNPVIFFEHVLLYNVKGGRAAGLILPFFLALFYGFKGRNQRKRHDWQVWVERLLGPGCARWSQYILTGAIFIRPRAGP